jgi:hypothetical protein
MTEKASPLTEEEQALLSEEMFKVAIKQATKHNHPFGTPCNTRCPRWGH